MPSYRFCRTDDIPLLTDAVSACYATHFPDRAELPVRDFKREIRELDVWCSSCMVALEDDAPIAVVTGAKRERETLIHRIGVRPGFERRGHARHLLESLSRKLAVLGPPRMVAELPEGAPAVRGLFEAVGYRAEGRFADFALAAPLGDAPVPAASAVAPATLDDLMRAGALDASPDLSWERALPTLQNRKDQLRGLAIASEARVEAHVLFRDLPERREIVALGVRENRLLLEIVLRVACSDARQVTLPRVSPQEIAWEALESMGFRRGGTTVRYAARAGA